MTSSTQIFFHVLLLLLVFAEEPWVPAGEGDSVISGVLHIGQSSDQGFWGAEAQQAPSPLTRRGRSVTAPSISGVWPGAFPRRPTFKEARRTALGGVAVAGAEGTVT